MTNHKKPPLTTCPHCGHDEFAITETYIHIGTVELETGILAYSSYPDSGGLDRIACARCELEISDDIFTAVEHY